MRARLPLEIERPPGGGQFVCFPTLPPGNLKGVPRLGVPAGARGEGPGAARRTSGNLLLRGVLGMAPGRGGWRVRRRCMRPVGVGNPRFPFTPQPRSPSPVGCGGVGFDLHFLWPRWRCRARQPRPLRVVVKKGLQSRLDPDRALVQRDELSSRLFAVSGSCGRACALLLPPCERTMARGG